MADDPLLEWKLRAEPAAINQFLVWIGAGEGGLDATVSGPNEAGVFHVTAQVPIEQREDIEAAVSAWNVEHPGAIIPPDDWLPK